MRRSCTTVTFWMSLWARINTFVSMLATKPALDGELPHIQQRCEGASRRRDKSSSHWIIGSHDQVSVVFLILHNSLSRTGCESERHPFHLIRLQRQVSDRKICPQSIVRLIRSPRDHATRWCIDPRAAAGKGPIYLK
jgi:hypothetical protein